MQKKLFKFKKFSKKYLFFQTILTKSLFQSQSNFTDVGQAWRISNRILEQEFPNTCSILDREWNFRYNYLQQLKQKNKKLYDSIIIDNFIRKKDIFKNYHKKKDTNSNLNKNLNNHSFKFNSKTQQENKLLTPSSRSCLILKDRQLNILETTINQDFLFIKNFWNFFKINIYLNKIYFFPNQKTFLSYWFIPFLGLVCYSIILKKETFSLQHLLNFNSYNFSLFSEFNSYRENSKKKFKFSSPQTVEKEKSTEKNLNINFSGKNSITLLNSNYPQLIGQTLEYLNYKKMLLEKSHDEICPSSGSPICKNRQQAEPRPVQKLSGLEFPSQKFNRKTQNIFEIPLSKIKRDCNNIFHSSDSNYIAYYINAISKKKIEKLFFIQNSNIEQLCDSYINKIRKIVYFPLNKNNFETFIKGEKKIHKESPPSVKLNSMKSIFCDALFKNYQDLNSYKLINTSSFYKNKQIDPIIDFPCLKLNRPVKLSGPELYNNIFNSSSLFNYRLGHQGLLYFTDYSYLQSNLSEWYTLSKNIFYKNIFFRSSFFCYWHRINKENNFSFNFTKKLFSLFINIRDNNSIWFSKSDYLSKNMTGSNLALFNFVLGWMNFQSKIEQASKADSEFFSLIPFQFIKNNTEERILGKKLFPQKILPSEQSYFKDSNPEKLRYSPVPVYLETGIKQELDSKTDFPFIKQWNEPYDVFKLETGRSLACPPFKRELNSHQVLSSQISSSFNSKLFKPCLNFIRTSKQPVISYQKAEYLLDNIIRRILFEFNNLISPEQFNKLLLWEFWQKRTFNLNSYNSIKKETKSLSQSENCKIKQETKKQYCLLILRDGQENLTISKKQKIKHNLIYLQYNNSIFSYRPQIDIFDNKYFDSNKHFESVLLRKEHLLKSHFLTNNSPYFKKQTTCLKLNSAQSILLNYFEKLKDIFLNSSNVIKTLVSKNSQIVILNNTKKQNNYFSCPSLSEFCKIKQSSVAFQSSGAFPYLDREIIFQNKYVKAFPNEILENKKTKKELNQYNSFFSSIKFHNQALLKNDLSTILVNKTVFSFNNKKTAFLNGEKENNIWNIKSNFIPDVITYKNPLLMSGFSKEIPYYPHTSENCKIKQDNFTQYHNLNCKEPYDSLFSPFGLLRKIHRIQSLFKNYQDLSLNKQTDSRLKGGEKKTNEKTSLLIKHSPVLNLETGELNTFNPCKFDRQQKSQKFYLMKSVFCNPKNWNRRYQKNLLLAFQIKNRKPKFQYYTKRHNKKIIDKYFLSLNKPYFSTMLKFPPVYKTNVNRSIYKNSNMKKTRENTLNSNKNIWFLKSCSILKDSLNRDRDREKKLHKSCINLNWASGAPVNFTGLTPKINYIPLSEFYKIKQACPVSNIKQEFSNRKQEFGLTRNQFHSLQRPNYVRFFQNSISSMTLKEIYFPKKNYKFHSLFNFRQGYPQNTIFVFKQHQPDKLKPEETLILNWKKKFENFVFSNKNVHSCQRPCLNLYRDKVKLHIKILNNLENCYLKILENFLFKNKQMQLLVISNDKYSKKNPNWIFQKQKKIRPSIINPCFNFDRALSIKQETLSNFKQDSNKIEKIFEKSCLNLNKVCKFPEKNIYFIKKSMSSFLKMQFSKRLFNSQKSMFDTLKLFSYNFPSSLVPQTKKYSNNNISSRFSSETQPVSRFETGKWKNLFPNLMKFVQFNFRQGFTPFKNYQDLNQNNVYLSIAQIPRFRIQPSLFYNDKTSNPVNFLTGLKKIKPVKNLTGLSINILKLQNKTSKKVHSYSSIVRFQKQKHIQKKRRQKKQKGRTRRRKKRKRFFPRPLWSRYHLYKNFLKIRFFSHIDLKKHPLNFIYNSQKFRNNFTTYATIFPLGIYNSAKTPSHGSYLGPKILKKINTTPFGRSIINRKISQEYYFQNRVLNLPNIFNMKLNNLRDQIYRTTKEFYKDPYGQLQNWRQGEKNQIKRDSKSLFEYNKDNKKQRFQKFVFFPKVTDQSFSKKLNSLLASSNKPRLNFDREKISSNYSISSFKTRMKNIFERIYLSEKGLSNFEKYKYFLCSLLGFEYVDAFYSNNSNFFKNNIIHSSFDALSNFKQDFLTPYFINKIPKPCTKNIKPLLPSWYINRKNFPTYFFPESSFSQFFSIQKISNYKNIIHNRINRTFRNFLNFSPGRDGKNKEISFIYKKKTTKTFLTEKNTRGEDSLMTNEFEKFLMNYSLNPTYSRLFLGYLPKIRFMWSLNKTNMWMFNKKNRKKDIWLYYKTRRQNKTNKSKKLIKELLNTFQQKNTLFNVSSKLTKKILKLKELGFHSSSAYNKKIEKPSPRSVSLNRPVSNFQTGNWKHINKKKSYSSRYQKLTFSNIPLKCFTFNISRKSWWTEFFTNGSHYFQTDKKNSELLSKLVIPIKTHLRLFPTKYPCLSQSKWSSGLETGEFPNSIKLDYKRSSYLPSNFSLAYPDCQIKQHSNRMKTLFFNDSFEYSQSFAYKAMFQLQTFLLMESLLVYSLFLKIALLIFFCNIYEVRSIFKFSILGIYKISKNYCKFTYKLFDFLGQFSNKIVMSHDLLNYWLKMPVYKFEKGTNSIFLSSIINGNIVKWKEQMFDLDLSKNLSSTKLWTNKEFPSPPFKRELDGIGRIQIQPLISNSALKRLILKLEILVPITDSFSDSRLKGPVKFSGSHTKSQPTGLNKKLASTDQSDNFLIKQAIMQKKKEIQNFKFEKYLRKNLIRELNLFSKNTIYFQIFKTRIFIKKPNFQTGEKKYIWFSSKKVPFELEKLNKLPFYCQSFKIKQYLQTGEPPVQFNFRQGEAKNPVYILSGHQDIQKSFLNIIQIFIQQQMFILNIIKNRNIINRIDSTNNRVIFHSSLIKENSFIPLSSKIKQARHQNFIDSLAKPINKFIPFLFHKYLNIYFNLSFLIITQIFLYIFQNSFLFFSSFIFRFIDMLEIFGMFIYKSLEKQTELVINWMAYGFVIEWSSDISVLIPDNFDIYNWKSLIKSARGFRFFGPFGTFFENRMKLLFLNSLQVITRYDSDLLIREKKGLIFWNVWSDILIKAAEKYNINIPSLANLKDEQELLVTKMLEDENWSWNNIDPLEREYLNQSIDGIIPKKWKDPYSFSTVQSRPGLKGNRKKLNFIQAIHSNFQLNKDKKNLMKNLTMSRRILFNINRHNTGSDLSLNPVSRFKTGFEFSSEKYFKSNIFLSKFQQGKKNSKKKPCLNFKENRHFQFFKKSDENWNRWFYLQYFTFQGKDTDFFIDIHPPKSFSHLSFIKYSEAGLESIGLLTCQIYSGTFLKQVSKNFLVLGAPGTEKSLLVQALAGETEIQIIVDNSRRYALVYRGIALGIKLLKDVFAAIALYTPCLFLLEEIHIIGEKRTLLISDDESSKITESYLGFDQNEIHEKNQVIYQLTKHALCDYKKPYKGDFSTLIPTHEFCFNLFTNNNSFKNRHSFLTPKNPLKMDSSPFEFKKEYSPSLNFDGDVHKYKNFHSPKNFKILTTRLQLSSEKFFAPPSTSPFNILILKEQKKLRKNQRVKEVSWGGTVLEKTTIFPQFTYSIKAKIAMLANMALTNFSVKLDIITDLLIIIDTTRSHRGFAVFATTHLPSLLDPALRRPGRLDDTITLPQKSSLLNKWEILNSNLAFKNSTIDLLNYCFHFNNFENIQISEIISRLKLQLFKQYSSSCSIIEQQQISSSYPSIPASPDFSPSPVNLSKIKQATGQITSSLIELDPFKRAQKSCQLNEAPLLNGIEQEQISSSLLFNTVQTGGQGQTLSPKIIQRTVNWIQPFKTLLGLNIIDSNFIDKPVELTGNPEKLTGNNRNSSHRKKSQFYRIPQTKQLLTRFHFSKSLSIRPSKILAYIYHQQGLILINAYFLKNLKSYGIHFSNFIQNRKHIETNIFQHFYTSSYLLKYHLTSLLSGKIAELFLFSNSKIIFPMVNPTISKNFESCKIGRESLIEKFHACKIDRQSTNWKKNKKNMCWNSLNNNKQYFQGLWSLYGIDNIWRSSYTFFLSFIQKRYLYHKSYVISRLFYIENKTSLKDPLGPPSSSLYLPGRKYENLKRLEAFFQQKVFFSISEKLKIHEQQRFIKKLYNKTIQNKFRSELKQIYFSKNIKTFCFNLKNERPSPRSVNTVEFLKTGRDNNNNNSFEYKSILGTNWSTSLRELIHLQNSMRVPIATNLYNRQKILLRHKFYLKNQWWNGHLAEQNRETTFLSDVDWRSLFQDSFGDILIDFPDPDQYYNPRTRRWMLNNGFWSYWENFQYPFYSEIYYHFTMECFNTALTFLNTQREMLDYFSYLGLKKNRGTEINFIQNNLRFYLSFK
nr:cell division protein [Trochiscia hystrix]